MFHHLDPLTVRAAFTDAAEVFVGVIGEIRPEQWEEPGLGEWTVRELAGHAMRAFTTLRRACETTAEHAAVESAPAYYRAVFREPDIHAGVAQRGREAGAQLVDPLASARAAADAAIGILAATPDEHIGETAIGPMRLADYLPTRVVELGVHSLDLQVATGQALALPASAASVVLGTLADVTDLPPVILALTGRRGLPDGFNILG